MGSYIRDFVWALVITAVLAAPFLILALTLN